MIMVIMIRKYDDNVNYNCYNDYDNGNDDINNQDDNDDNSKY